jgi:heat shock protein HtpX
VKWVLDTGSGHELVRPVHRRLAKRIPKHRARIEWRERSTAGDSKSNGYLAFQMLDTGRNYTKTALLLGLLTGLLVLLGWFVGGSTWAVYALVFAVVLNFASYWWSDRIVLALHGAQPIAPGELPELHRIVERLATRAGIPKPRLYRVRDAAANAFATGRNPEHAVVCVTDGILELCNEVELEGVLAHELSHVNNRDILISSVAATLAGAIALLGRLLFFGGGRDDRDRGGVGGALLVSLVAGFVATLFQLAVSRSREYGADSSGARLAGSARGLASALRKLGTASGRIPMRTASPATAHLYIVAPLSAQGGALSLFMTHPPLERRIARLEQMEATHG